MKNKNKSKREITIKSLNKGFAIALFALVFVFTFALIDNTVKAHMGIWGIALGCALAALGIAWLTTLLVFRNRQNAKDQNKQKIDAALDRLKEQAKEDQKKKIDESNS